MRVFKIIFLLCVMSAQAQKQITNTKIEFGNYIFTSDFQTNYTTDFNGEKIQEERIIHHIGSIINAIKVVNDTTVIIQYYKSKSYANNDNKIKGNTFNEKYFKSDNILKYFKIKIDDFLKVTTKYYSLYKGASAGFYSVPFKLRFNNFDFEQELNIGLSIGAQYRLSRKLKDRWILEPNIGVGLAKIDLNSKNSNVDESRTASAFSISSGLLLRFSKNINAGLFVGWDFLANEDSDTNWEHDGKAWLGIGINIGFNISNSKESKETNSAK